MCEKVEQKTEAVGEGLMSEWEKLKQPQRQHMLDLPPKRVFSLPDFTRVREKDNYHFKLQEVDIREIMFRALTFVRTRYLDVLVHDHANQKIDLNALQICIRILGGAIYNPIIIVPVVYADFKYAGWLVHDGARRVQINWEAGLPTMNVAFFEYHLNGSLENIMWFKRDDKELADDINDFMKQLNYKANFSYPMLYQKA